MNRNDAAMVYLSNTCIIINISLRITFKKSSNCGVIIYSFMKSDHACEVLRWTGVTTKTSLDFVCPYDQISSKYNDKKIINDLFIYYVIVKNAIDFKIAVVKSKNNRASAQGFSVCVNHFSLIVFSIIPPHFRIWTLVTGCFTEYRIWNVRNNNFILLFVQSF